MYSWKQVFKLSRLFCVDVYKIWMRYSKSVMKNQPHTQLTAGRTTTVLRQSTVLQPMKNKLPGYIMMIQITLETQILMAKIILPMLIFLYGDILLFLYFLVSHKFSLWDYADVVSWSDKNMTGHLFSQIIAHIKGIQSKRTDFKVICNMGKPTRTYLVNLLGSMAQKELIEK